MPRRKHERPLALEKLRHAYPIREAIETDVASFKAACRTSKSNAIAALPVYIDRFRPEVELELARQPAAPQTLTRRQRADDAQPCLLCGAPILGRGYASTAAHRARCKVMAALVEERCIVEFLDVKNIDLSWGALRQLTPRFKLPKRHNVPLTPMDREGREWQKLKNAMAAEVAAMIEKGVVVTEAQPLSEDPTEAKAGSSDVAGTNSKRKRMLDDGDEFEMVAKRPYPGSQGIEFGEPSGLNREGETDEE